MKLQYRWHSAKRWGTRGVFKSPASVFPRPEKLRDHIYELGYLGIFIVEAACACRISFNLGIN
jgi:hypothetical protein